MSLSISDLSPEERSTELYYHLDPCFVNLRKCFSVFGSTFANYYQENAKPGDAWPATLINDHLAVDIAMELCRQRDVRSLSMCLAAPRVGDVFCGLLRIRGDKRVYEKDSYVTFPVVLPFDSEFQVDIEFGTSHLVSDTGRLYLTQEFDFGVIGVIHAVSDKVLIHPAIMGFPTFDHSRNKGIDTNRLAFFSTLWHHTLAGDIEQFSAITTVEAPEPEEWMPFMEGHTEAQIKHRFCDILGELPTKDWGGELADHYSASVRLFSKLVTAAFLFKGPSQFREMKPRMLGKNADQIFRLTSTTADLLVVQHCHDIGVEVRETLRSFAVAAHRPRRYCLIDGRDTYRIFKAYGKL